VYSRGSRIAQGWGRTMRLADAGCVLQNNQSSLHDTTITIKCQAGGALTILWGDGTASAVTCNNVANTYVHTYAATGLYTIRIVGTTRLISLFQVVGQTWISGSISAITQGLSASLTALYLYNTGVSGDINVLSLFTGMTVIMVYGTSLTGNISSVAALTGLNILYINSTPGVTGDIRSLAGLTQLIALRISSTGIGDYTTGPLPAWPASNMQLYSIGLSSAEVDAFLIDFADGAGAAGSINIAGTNAARTHASDAAKAALDAAGWAVTVNGP